MVMLENLRGWLNDAKPGDTAVYHRGWHLSAHGAVIGGAVMERYEAGQVLLTQRKTDEWHTHPDGGQSPIYEYRMTKRERRRPAPARGRDMLATWNIKT